MASFRDFEVSDGTISADLVAEELARIIRLREQVDQVKRTELFTQSGGVDVGETVRSITRGSFEEALSQKRSMAVIAFTELQDALPKYSSKGLIRAPKTAVSTFLRYTKADEIWASDEFAKFEAQSPKRKSRSIRNHAARLLLDATGLLLLDRPTLEVAIAIATPDARKGVVLTEEDMRLRDTARAPHDVDFINTQFEEFAYDLVGTSVTRTVDQGVENFLETHAIWHDMC